MTSDKRKERMMLGLKILDTEKKADKIRNKFNQNFPVPGWLATPEGLATLDALTQVEKELENLQAEVSEFFNQKD